MADDFTRRKFKWLDQVVEDRGVSALAFRLAYVLASAFWNRGTNDAWPGQSKLAERTFITPRGVRNLIEQLVSFGHLEVTDGRGRGHTNHYRPVLKPRDGDPQEVTADGDNAEVAGSLFPELEADRQVKPKRTGARAVADAGFVMEFEQQWWPHYPRETARAEALEAYIRVRRSGISADVLLAGVLRYAAHRSGQDPYYTKEAKNWINQRRWEDEILPSPSGASKGPTIDQSGLPVHDAAGRRVERQTESWTDIAMKGVRS
jgi:hypothetical protein